MSDTYFNIGSPVKDFVSSFIDGLETALTNKGYITCSESEAQEALEETGDLASISLSPTMRR